MKALIKAHPLLILGIILFTVFIVYIIVSPSARSAINKGSEQAIAQAEERERFIEVHDQGSFFIMADKETRVMYLVYAAGYKGGITVMLNPDGTPMLWNGELK